MAAALVDYGPSHFCGACELAVVVLQALLVHDKAAAAAVLADQSLAAGVLAHWQAAVSTLREQEARWPALQGLVMGLAATHQQLQAAAADIAARAVTAARHAQGRVVGAAAVSSASVAAVAAVADVAALAQDGAADAAATAAAAAAISATGGSAGQQEHAASSAIVGFVHCATAFQRTQLAADWELCWSVAAAVLRLACMVLGLLGGSSCLLCTWCLAGGCSGPVVAQSYI